MDILYKYGAIIVLFINISLIKQVSAQYKYSIDIKEKKSRRVPLKFLIQQTRQNLKTGHKANINRRKIKRASKAISKHTYNIQTREVKRRMKKTRKKANNHNENKITLSDKLKIFFDG